MRESKVETYLIERVKDYGGEIRKVNWIARKGAPDRMVLFKQNMLTPPGWGVLWVELKAPGVMPEPHQMQEHKRLRAFGQKVFVIDSFAGVDDMLNQADLRWKRFLAP